MSAWFDTLGQDIRCAWRALRTSQSYAAWVIGSLAIGMAVTIAALALLNAALLLPFPEVTAQDRLVRVSVSYNCGRPDCWRPMSSAADYHSLEEGLTGLQGLAAYTVGELAVALPEARSMRGALTSPNYFEVLGVRPAVGRLFNAADGRPDGAIAVISHSTWRREFGADPSAIGRSIRVADRFVQIVGVAPALFSGVDRTRPGGRNLDIWLPMSLADRVLPLTTTEQRQQQRAISFLGRLKDDVEVERLQTEAEVVSARLAAQRGLGTQGGIADVRRVWRVSPRSWHFAVMIVMPIPTLVLVIACVNAANLMLARGSQRRREMAIRLAIGAERGRLVRQLLIESAVLALVASAVAVPIAWWGLEIASNPLATSIPIDTTVLALTVLTAAATTVAFGLAPALRVSAQQPSSTLGPMGSHNDTVPRQSRMRRGLVIAQVALSLALLATAWQLVATVRLQAVSSGTPPDRLLIARFNLDPVRLGPSDVEAFYRDLVAAAGRLPGVEAAGVARHTSVWTFGQGAAPASVMVWEPSDAPEDGHITIGGYAGADLFEAVGLPTIAGRTFTEADRQGRPQVAVVNRTFAQKMAGPAVGSLIRIAPRAGDFGSAIDVRIVGVIEPALEPRFTQDGPPAAKVYLPSPIEPEAALALYVRTRARAATLAQPIREIVNRIAPRVPILELGTLEELNERSYGQQLWLARAAALLGVMGLLLATAGLYGVSSYVVAMRSREISIRMAIGATPQTILTMVLRQSMRVAVIGLLAGGTAAVAVSRVIQSEYHGIQGIDASAFGGAIALFLVSMFLASTVPAIRASRVDPVANLKDA